MARVVSSTAISATLAALAAAAASLFVADRLVTAAEDQRLLGMARIAVTELPANPDDPALAEAIREEEGEIAPASMRIVARRGTFVTGDARLPALPNGECASSPVEASTLRACGLQAGNLNVVVGSIGVAHSASLLIPSLLAATLMAAVVATLLGRRAARWALAPLNRLRESLGTISVDAPDAANIATDDSCDEVAALGSALQLLIGRLSDALGAARRFSAEAAHELRTPLTSIRAELELLAEEPLSDEVLAAVTRLRARAVALGKLVERLLMLAGANDRGNAMTTAVALEDVVRDVIARTEPATQERLRFAAGPQGMVLGDEILLASLVENVIENALKFSGGGSVDVSVEEPAGSVVLLVRDRGPGLTVEERARAFEPFFRTPAARGANTPGHGIGLALVAQIARAHAGTVEFVDVPTGEVGAQLRVSLPAWSAEAAQTSLNPR